jgi:uncharacterized SAM-binding protein YcdF (DUF218 family)
MPRAVRLFEERGLQVIPAPTHYELLAGLRDRVAG